LCFCMDWLWTAILLLMILLLMLPTQLGHRWEHHTRHICWDRVSLTFGLGWLWTMILLIFTSQVAGIIHDYLEKVFVFFFQVTGAQIW
jgi:hypothetical protein